MKKVIALGLMVLTSVAHAASAVIEWTPPDFYVDGMELPASEILSYTLYYGQEPGNYTQQVTITPDAQEHTISGLSGTWYFVMTARSLFDSDRDKEQHNEKRCAMAFPVARKPSRCYG
jgi:hypothetical protein